MVENFDVLGIKSLFLFCILLRVLRQFVSSSICFALTIVNPKIIIREFLGLADFSGAQILYIYKPTKVVIVGEHKNFMLRAL